MNAKDNKPGALPQDRHLETARRLLTDAAMGQAAKIRIPYEDLTAYFSGLKSESDRAAGILAFAFVESQISEIFGQHLDEGIQGGIGSIIGPQGILDSVGAQIRVLRALGWLRERTYRNLRLLARIRNRFAHAHVALTFEDKVIKGYFHSLDKYEEQHWKEFSDVNLSLKGTFLVRTIMTLFELYADLCLIPASKSVGFGSHGALAAGFDQFPEQLRNALASCMAAIEAVYEGAAEPSSATRNE
jgi:DNA-binding MltR family transcriptional regulator